MFEIKKTVAFLTLGCKVNSYETDAMKKLFADEGCEIVDFTEIADIYVVNTCTVTNIADRKSRQMLHKAKKMNADSIVVAVGCYVQAAAETLEADSAIDIVIGNNNKVNIIDIIKSYSLDHSNNEAILNIDHENIYEELSIESVGEKTRAYIKIQDGCNQFCSYCIIPYARGRVRSRKREDVLEEVKNLVSKKYKEVVLTGIHLSSYGIDFNKDVDMVSPNLLSLIMDISMIEGIERIRLGSLEPRIITEEFAKTLASNKKFCPHFHLSLQSGSNQTLKRMNRRYTAEEYYDKCNILREYFDSPAITTDVIVGFPGETDAEFEETKNYLEKIDFSKMHVFKYSKRKGTKAETMLDQVDEKIKTSRSKELANMDNIHSNGYKNSFIGKEVCVLFEEEIEIDQIKYQVGHTKHYVKVAIRDTDNHINEIVKVKITESLNKDILLCDRVI